MYFKQADIFWGMGKNCVKQIVEASRKESFEKGHVLFEEGAPADRFYSLIRGSVRLSTRKVGQHVYTVSRAGEAFGWSSLIGGDVYTATAEITAPSVLMAIDKDRLHHLLEENPGDGLLFYKHLARTLGNRLLNSYDLISQLSREATAPSQGTGQVRDEAYH